MHLLLCGHGYLGQAITRDFLAAGWQVSAVNRDLPKNPQSAIHNPQFHQTDLSSKESIARLSSSIDKPDFIVHCASSARGGPNAYRAVYHDGCRHLTEAFPGIPLLFTSSTSVYAQTDGSVVTEESPAEPDRETGQILRQSEDLVLASNGIVLRLAGIYGPHRSVILKKLLAGESRIEEDGRRFLNQIHRDDATRAVLHAATLPLNSGIYNLSDSHPRTQRETLEALAGMFELPIPESVPRDPDRKRGWTHKQVSNAKLIGTGWKPGHPDFLTAAPEVAETLRQQGS